MILPAWLTVFGALTALAASGDYFQIEVVDEQTGRGVPLVELRTVNDISYWTDSNGLVAFLEPGLMELEVFFHVSSPGYEFPKDFFGNRGVKLRPSPGASAQIRLKRLNLAERFYRITGQGIYRDSVLTGHRAPLPQPVLNGQVTGQDTVIATPYRGRLYWFWGDTGRPSYPLGNFGASGATSDWPGRSGLDPAVGVALTYFVDASGFSKPMCPLPTKEGLRWIEGLMTVPDERGRERLVARVANMHGLDYAYDWHLMVFNDDQQAFESVQRWEIRDPHESAHPARVRVMDRDFYYLFPNYRVPAELSRLRDLKNYEAFTCVAGEGRWRGAQTAVDRDPEGRPRFAWKPGADRLHVGRLNELIAAGKLKPEESWARVLDFETGRPLARGPSAVAWNQFRGQWVAFFADQPGDAWFAEADTPLGPWGYARRVLTHGDYNFYNLAHHPFFDQGGGRLVYFEGTYTDTFSPARVKTPRYDYNQVMYRLALDDSRLTLPVPIYRVRGTNGTAWLWRGDQVAAASAWERVVEVAWFALPPASGQPDTVPIYAVAAGGDGRLSTRMPTETAQPLFVALPLLSSSPTSGVAGVWRSKAKIAEGPDFDFELRLTGDGTTLTATTDEPNLKGKGTLREDQLELRLDKEGEVHWLQARLVGLELNGTWRKEDGPHGTWTARRIEPGPPERSSPAVVPLYEHRGATGERRAYSLRPEPAAGFTGAEPLARVWKPVASVLTLDWQTRPRGDNTK